MNEPTIEMITDKRNAMEFWLHKVSKISLEIRGIYIPHTYSVKMTNKQFDNYCGFKLESGFIQELSKQIEAVIWHGRLKYPVFMRTSLSACKHEWNDTCYVKDADCITQNLFNMLEGDLNKIAPTPRVIFVRQMLDLEHTFTAFNGMPIAKEFRVFSEDGALKHFQPYWIPNSIRRPSIENWKDELKKLHEINDREKTFIVNAANYITSKLTGHWSVDFCKTSDGLWYITDMALGDVSFKWNPDEFNWDFPTDEDMSEFDKIIKETNDEL